MAASIGSGQLHAALVPEPLASRLLAAGRAKLLADFRTPQAVAQALGRATVNAAFFVRADRRLRSQDLTALARAPLAAQERTRTGSAQEPAATLGRHVTGTTGDYRAA